MSNPFSTTTSKPGHGTIHLALLPPSTPRLKTASYQYPLKLVTPDAYKTPGEPSDLIHTVYLLTYGGGLVAGDVIDLDVVQEQSTKLVLLTQGSTKLLRSPSRGVVSKQCTNVRLAPGSALCYLPDPVQPFERSCFEQTQTFTGAGPSATEAITASLCALDWVSNGRPANGENWSFFRYGSRTEVFCSLPDGTRRLLLRDNILLDDHGEGHYIANHMNGLAVFGTLILCGPLFRRLGKYFMDEFAALPRIGGRKWDTGDETGDEETDPSFPQRAARQKQEIADGLLWSAASLRGCVTVKFGAKEVEIGKRWLRTMLVQEGSVVREFGEQALLCLQ